MTVRGAYARDRPHAAMMPAAAAAQEGGWKRGTMLRSSRWKGDRRVERVSGDQVGLRGFYARGNSTVSWVKLVPRDVEVVNQGEPI